jgi:ribosomal protein S18 acetylase RimI-like enzyme
MDPRNRSDVEAVATLHEQFLGDSPVARMGPAFVRDVYYSKLIRDGLYDCLVCRSEGRIVAFISYTDRPLDLMSRGLKRHFFSVAWSVGRTVVMSPKRLRDVLYVVRIMGDHNEATGDKALLEGAAEALSMAVLPEFQNVVPAGGKSRVAVRLIESMAADMRARKVRDIAFYVDPANRAANLLYSAMGCKFEKVMHGGVPRHRFIYPVAPRLDAAR